MIVDSISLYGQHRFFLNNSLDNLVKNLGENDYHVIRGFNADVSGLVKKESFFPIATEIALKNLKKVYLRKTNFIIH